MRSSLPAAFARASSWSPARSFPRGAGCAQARHSVAAAGPGSRSPTPGTRSACSPACRRRSGPGGARGAAPLVTPLDRSGDRALRMRVLRLRDEDRAGVLRQRRREIANARPAADRDRVDPDVERMTLPRVDADPLPVPRDRAEREHLAADPPPARHEAAAIAVRVALPVAQLEALRTEVVPR